jgi:hypothetical protein
MARFQTELENLQKQQKETIEKFQAAEAEASRYRELTIKLQGAIEILTSMDQVPEETSVAPVNPEVMPEVPAEPAPAA